ncbi:MAG TPA: helix-turn-helix domain-containing protein, partial [Bacteroidales bacterium]|nr:helix-turn-helix domain-containing protein [Bacteroidales bacterium]
RELTSITIEKHLVYFVAEGMLDATELIDKQTLQTITKTIKTLQTKSLKEVKDALPDYISYTEIRFAMAYLESR